MFRRFAGGGVIVGLVAWLCSATDAPPERPISVLAAVPPTAGAPAPGPGGAAAGSVRPLPRLRTAPSAPATERGEAWSRAVMNTDVDGSFRADAGGHFVVDRSAMRRVEYYFLASGERSDEEIANRIIADAASLPQPARRQAEDFVARVVRYRDAGRRSVADHDVPASIEAGQQWLRALRAEHFGPNADALFDD